MNVPTQSFIVQDMNLRFALVQVPPKLSSGETKYSLPLRVVAMALSVYNLTERRWIKLRHEVDHPQTRSLEQLIVQVGHALPVATKVMHEGWPFAIAYKCDQIEFYCGDKTEKLNAKPKTV
jgi:hypothetical protein